MKPGATDKKKKLKLQVHDDINFKLIGISSHENDYRLVWAINSQLHLQFIRIENLVIHNKKLGADQEFSRYLYTDEDKLLDYYLISNRCPDGFLFPGIKNVDFLVMISGEISDPELKSLLQNLKGVDVISASFALETDKLKGWKEVLQV